MDKIYRRATQKGQTSPKKKDEKNRKRNVIVNFRVSQEEKQLIDARIQMSGLPRAEFFIESCLYQSILVRGNARTFSNLQNQMDALGTAITQNPDIGELDSIQQETLRIILEILSKAPKKNGT